MERDLDGVRRFQHIRTRREIAHRVMDLYRGPGRPSGGEVLAAIDSVHFADTRRTDSDEVLADWVDGQATYEDVVDSFPTTDPMRRLGRWVRRTLHLK